jgi:hypothetical protein
MAEQTLTPAQMAEAHRREQEENRAKNSYRFPEGNGPDEDGKGHHGKILKAEDTVTERKKTPVWELIVGTNERHPKDNKKVDIKINFWKSPKTLPFFYAFLEMAGADLSQLSDPATHDEKVQLLLEKLEEENPKIRFYCKWQKPAEGEKENRYNNYYINECEKVLEGVLAPAEAPAEAPAVEKKTEPEAPAEPATPAEPTDSAFADDDD